MNFNYKRFLSGDGRTAKVKKNIVASAVFKVADTLLFLLLVPLTLGYVNAYEYGIWLTLHSILAWLNSFDVGLGNGLRNKLAEAIANDDKEKARIYVSTTFFMLISIAIFLLFVFFVLFDFIDWYKVLNVDETTISNLNVVVFVSLSFACMNFVLRFIGNVFQALQMPSITNAISFAAHLFSVVVIFIFTKTIPGSLFWVAFIYSASFPFIYVLAYPVTFYKLYPYLKPSWNFFRRENLKDLFSLSVRFFLLQIAGILLFSISNLVISNMFGPDQVTPYNIAYKYFSIPAMAMGLILAPMWSASTDAYTRGDMKWIENCLRKIKLTLYGLALLLMLMTVCSPLAFKIWVGDSVNVPLSLSVLMAGYQFIYVLSLSFSYFLNGIGKLKLQTINTCVVAILFYPLCLLFGNKFGVLGIVMTMCIVNLSGAVLNIVQLRKVINKTATGIWNR